jgi:Phage terminase large subunit
MPEQVHTFVARGANLEAMRSKALKVVLAGPAGTGKSRVWLEKAHQLCLRTAGVKCLLLRKTLVSLTASGVQTYKNDVAREAITDGSVTFFGGSQLDPPAFRYSNGSSIALGGMDNPLKVMSTEYDWIFVQEASELTIEELEMASSRLRNGKLRGWHQLAMDCNPQQPTHPLKIECDQGRMTMLHSRHEDNPRYFNADGTMTAEGRQYMSILDSLTGVRYLRLRKGIWAAAEGVIYDDFQAATHIVPRFEVPREWRRVWAVDFGYVHPFVWQDWAVGPDGQMVLVKEIFRTRMLVEDHAREIKAITANDPRPHALICDHDAEDRATLERHLGRATRAANKAVSQGLQAVAARMRPGHDGKPRIMFMRDAAVRPDPELIQAKRPACTVDEIPGYVWNDRRAEQPVKEMDDGCDTMRYAVAHVDLQGRARIRILGA